MLQQIQTNGTQLQLEDQVRVLETKLETALTDNRKLQDQLSTSQATCQSVSGDLEKKKAENVRLMTQLNEARAQLNFETGKVASVTQQLQAEVTKLQDQVRAEQAKFAEHEQKMSQFDAQLRNRKDELDKKRNEMFELHNNISQKDAKAMMQTQEVKLMQRRVQDLVEKESTLLKDQQKLIGERDAVQFQMASLQADLNTQKSAAVLQQQRFELESQQSKQQLRQVEAQLVTAQANQKRVAEDHENERLVNEKARMENIHLRSQLQNEATEKSRYLEESKHQKTFITKLQSEKTETHAELASLKKNVNKIMLTQRDPGMKAEAVDDERLRLGERMLAECQTRKKDTSLLGSQLQEVLVRNETLSNSILERNSALIEAKNQIEQFKKKLETLVREKRQNQRQKDQLSAQNMALSSTLSQRQLNEQKMYHYARRLETAVREQHVFPQVQVRLEELEKAQSADELFKKKDEETLAKNVKIDDLQRQVKVLTLEKGALQGELTESQDLIKDKEEQLQRIYKKLNEKHVAIKLEADDVHMQEQNPKAAESHREIEFAKLLEALEGKTSEIIDLKGRLHTSENELASLKRAQMNGIGFKVQQNDQQINSMALNAESAAQQMRSFTDLQSKYMDVQRQFSSLQTEQLSLKHQIADQEMKLQGAETESQLLKKQIEQKDTTLKTLTGQIDEMRSRKDNLELQLSTSVNQAAFIAMETQFKSKQGEINKLNGEMTQLRQENFAMRAGASNNQLKVNNLNEQLKLKDREREELEATTGQEVRQLQSQLSQFQSQNNLIVDQHRDEKGELQRLLLSKEDEHQAELQEREHLIVKLQEVITETAESNKKMRTELETGHKAELDTVCQKHQEAVQEIKDQLVQTQEASAKIANENAQYKKQVDVLLSQKETLTDVGEIQTEEIERLRALPEEKKQYLSTQQLQALNARVDQLKLAKDEQTSQNVQLRAENEILQKSAVERQNLYQAEISGLKDQLADLKNQNQVLMTDVKRHQERNLLSLVQPDDEKKAELEKEVNERSLVMQERCVKAEREVEQMRQSLQSKASEIEGLKRELAQLKFSTDQLKSELERAKQEALTKDINLRGYNELAQVNSDLNKKNIDVVSRLNNLQGKIDQIEAQEKEFTEAKQAVATTKTENDKLRLLVKKKMQEVQEIKNKSDAEVKALTDKHQAETQALQQSSGAAAAATATTMTSGEKKELMDALELLKSENQNLQSRISGDAHGPMPQQQVFKSLMMSLSRAKMIIQTLDNMKSKDSGTGAQAEAGEAAAGGECLAMPQVGQKRQRQE